MIKGPSSVIINADDFGISPGVNRAIIETYTQGLLTSASLLANGRFFQEALADWRSSCPGLALGIHINLCYGRAISAPEKICLLVDAQGFFKYGFTGLLLRSLWPSAEWRKQIRTELVAQFEQLKQQGVTIAHIDGHRHVQMLPAVYQELLVLKQTYAVPRLRVINESLRETVFWSWQARTCFPLSGLLKYLLLRALTLYCGASSAVRFFSILYTCALQPRLLARAMACSEAGPREIMVHPGDTAVDRECMQGDPEYPGLSAEYRDRERKLLLQEWSV